MAKRIRRNEISEEDIYRDIKDSARETIEVTKKLNEELNESARILKQDLTPAANENSKAIQKMLANAERANKMKKEAVRLDKQRVTAEDQLRKAELQSEKLKREKLKTEAQEIRNATQLKREKERQAKAEERAAKAARDESDAYKQLSKRTREQKNESKRLAAEMIRLADQGGRNTKEYRNLASQYRKVTTAANQGDKALKKIDSTVGDNFRNVGNYRSALDGLKTSFVRVAGALGLFQAVRGTTEIVAKFDQAQGDLLAISGKTAEQTAELTKQAKELGATTQFSATQITEMQIELAKLGFTTQQITQSTAAVSNFAAATGADIPEAAALAGAALRGFGLDASEMERVVSTLGVATTKTALDFSALQSGLSTIAPVANAFGFSIEDTTALLGQLANSGFDASSAATATRNILLNLADANGALAKELGRPIKSADDLAAGLQELQERGIDLASALELTDKRSVAAFQTFIKGSDSLVELRDSITDVNEDLEAMAEKRLDTISGQFTLLASAWEGFILSVNEGTGIGETVKNIIGGLAENLDSVLSILGTAIKLFLVYKTRLIALRIAQKAFGDGTGKLSFSLKTLTRNLTSSEGGLKKFGSALKGIGWTAAIGLALELANTFIDIATGADVAKRQMDTFNQVNARSTEITNANIDAIRSQIDEEKKRLELLVSTGDLTEEIANEQLKAFIEQEKFIGQIATQIGGPLVDEYRNFNGEVRALIREQEKQIGISEATIKQLKREGEFKNRLAIAEEEGLIANAVEQIKLLKEFQDELKNEQFQLQVSANEFKKFGRNKVDILDEQKKKYKDLTDQILKAAEAEREYFRIIEDFQIEGVQRSLDRVFENAIEVAQKSGDVQFGVIDDLIEKEKELRKAKLERILIDKIDAAKSAEEVQLAQEEFIQNTIRLEAELIDKRTEMLETLNEAQEDWLTARNAANDKANEELLKQEAEAAKRRMELARLVADYYIKQSDRRIEQLDKEISNAEKQQDFLRDLAAEGNINAQQSLAEEQRIINEANRAKLEEQRRQQRIELALSAYQAYQQKVQSGSSQPLAETIADITFLQQFINALPAFKEGTEDTGINGRGVDGQGGFHAILHPHERVIPKEQNDKLKGVSNVDLPELVKIGQDYISGKIGSYEGAVQIGSGWDSMEVVSRLESIEKTIKDRPELAFETLKAVDGSLRLVGTMKEKQTVTQHVFKVRKS